jgi:hypothetical protein
VPELSRSSRSWAARVAAVLLFGTSTATADVAPAPPARGVVTLRLENDTFAGLDYWYSHGHELAAVVPVVRRRGRVLRFRLAIGQALYTPRNIHFREPPPRDLPFAAQLRVDAGAILDDVRTTFLLRARFGVVGRAAGGEATQDGIHAMLGVRRPEGWIHQLPDQRAGGLAVATAWHPRLELDGLALVPVGLLRVEAGAMEGRATAGIGLALVHAARAESFLDPELVTTPCRSACAAAFVGVTAAGVWRDLVAEASDAASPPDITRRPWHVALRAGFLLGGPRAAVRFVHVLESRRFDTATRVHPRIHRWGSLELQLPFGGRARRTMGREPSPHR